MRSNLNWFLCRGHKVSLFGKFSECTAFRANYGQEWNTNYGGSHRKLGQSFLIKEKY